MINFKEKYKEHITETDIDYVIELLKSGELLYKVSDSACFPLTLQVARMKRIFLLYSDIKTIHCISYENMIKYYPEDLI